MSVSNDTKDISDTHRMLLSNTARDDHELTTFDVTKVVDDGEDVSSHIETQEVELAREGEEVVTTKEITSMHIPGLVDTDCSSKIETKDAMAYLALFLIATILICTFVYSHREHMYFGELMIAAIAIVMGILFYVGFAYNNACGYYLNIGILFLLFLSILAWAANVVRRADLKEQGSIYYGNGFFFLIIILLLLIFYMYTMRNKLAPILLLIIPIVFFCYMSYLWLYEV